MALTVGTFGRTASLYNLLSRCEVFGLSPESARHEITTMLHVVKTWRQFFAANGVEQRSIEMLDQAILPASFYREEPPQAL